MGAPPFWPTEDVHPGPVADASQPGRSGVAGSRGVADPEGAASLGALRDDRGQAMVLRGESCPNNECSMG